MQYDCDIKIGNGCLNWIKCDEKVKKNAASS